MGKKRRAKTAAAGRKTAAKSAESSTKAGVGKAKRRPAKKTAPSAVGGAKKRGSKRDRQRLAHAAGYTGRRETVQEIIATGIDVNFVDEDWRSTPLIGATTSGRVDVMEDLIRAGADVNFKDSRGATALFYAQPDSEAARLLKKHGAVAVAPEEDKLEEWEKPTERRRGVISFAGNHQAMLVRGDVGDVARAYAELRNATTWIEDIRGLEVELPAVCFVVFRHRGHVWTEIDGRPVEDFTVMAAESNRRPRDTRALSARLDTQAIDFAVSDTAGYYGYKLFEGGELIEKLECCEENEFASKRGRKEPKWRDVEEFIDAFFREQDAWVSGSGFATFAGYGHQTGDRVELRRPDEVERFDFIAW